MSKRGTPLGLDPSSTTLLVIDMQNAFCHPEGSFAKMTAGRGLSIAMCQDAVIGCARLIHAARQASIPVIYTRYVYHPNYADGGVLLAKYPEMREIGALAAGSWDADISNVLAPTDNDFVIDKSRYSAFYGTRLEPILHGLGISNIICCGVTTNICVESSVRDAAQRDYSVYVVADATGELTQDRHNNALDILDYGFADVVTADDIVHALKPPATDSVVARS